MRKGSGTFFVYGKSYGESTQNGKQERVKAGYHHGDGILPFALHPPVRFGSIATYVRAYATKQKILL